MPQIKAKTDAAKRVLSSDIELPAATRLFKALADMKAQRRSAVSPKPVMPGKNISAADFKKIISTGNTNSYN